MRGVSRRGTRRVGSGRRVVGWLLFLALFLAVLLAVSGPASAAGTQGLGENDTDAPEWTNATKAGPTEIELTFTDNGTVDSGSITADDFALSNGSLEDVEVAPTGDGVTVTLRLGGRLNENNVTVRITEDGAIADASGNELTAGNRTVSGMDTLVPDFERFQLSRVNDSTVLVTVAASEPLSGLRISVSGPISDRLTVDNVTATDDSNTTFSTRYTVPEPGSYSFVWERAIDSNGNMRTMSRMEQFRYEDSTPEVVLDGPDSAAVEQPVNFSAAETVDEDGIDSYRWRIDGGTVLSGPSIQVAFTAAGRHEIELAVTDSEGNTALVTKAIRVRRSADSPGAVSITRRNATHATATVEGTGLVQQVRAENGSLVERGNVTLERLTGAFPVNRSVSLNVSARARPPSSLDATGVGLFEIDHDAPANRVTLRFSVDRDALNRTGLAPGEVALYRDADGWTELTTSVVSRTNGSVVYQASAPGFSRFAVAEASPDVIESRAESPDSQSGVDGETANETDGSTTDDGTANATDDSTATTSDGPSGRSDIVVENVTVNETSPTVNGTVRIDVTASNGGDADGRYPFSVRLNESVVATHEITVPAGETRTASYTQELTETGNLTVAGEQVANVSTASDSSGSIVPGSVAGLLAAVPNPLALWPGGIVGTVLGGLVGLVVVTYGVLKALAIYLGY